MTRRLLIGGIPLLLPLLALGAAADNQDFVLDDRECKIVVGTLADGRPLAVAEGLKWLTSCQRRGDKTSCDATPRESTAAEKVNSFELHVDLDSPPRLWLAGVAEGHDFIRIDTVQHTYVWISRIMSPELPGQLGVQLCRGIFMTKSEIDHMPARRANRSASSLAPPVAR
jgi:hypothetical protein